MAISVAASEDARSRAEDLLSALSLEEKVGQLVLVEGAYGQVPESLRDAIANGRAGAVINEVDPHTIAELQRIAREESRQGIPLLIGRDVIHGFKTIFPIPLGLAATWDEALVQACAQESAREAAEQGVNWTFAPMLDISRDPRWGRIAESFGEDPHLTSRMGSAMVRGFQNGTEHQLISCLKHFAGYGASEAGKDYNTTNIPEVELRNVYLPPFKACLEAGALTIMTSFSDLNGMPASGNAWLLDDVLRREWRFTGFVVSDWCSISQLVVHGVAENDRDAALKAVRAGLNMDMVGGCYASHLEALIHNGVFKPEVVDALVLEVLSVKYHMGLFDAPARRLLSTPDPKKARELAVRAAEESIVLLKNEDQVLPLGADVGRVLLVGPLADQPREQLGTWIFDADESLSVTVKDAFSERLGDRLCFDPVLATSRDKNRQGFDHAKWLAESCETIVAVLGEESILSGEAHCRADITLPGAQTELVAELASLGKPLVVVVMAGRPLAIPELGEQADALLYAWHPGSMAGPGLANVIFGDVDASGRLPVTLPRLIGQVPIYYAQGHTGKPATPETIVHLDDIEHGAAQTSVGNTSFHLDVHPSPLYPFGFGLSYGQFAYADFRRVKGWSDALHLEVNVRNVGSRGACEVVQLYVRDLVASATRPVRELKAHERIWLEPEQERVVSFVLTRESLAFFNGVERVFEPGAFRFWVGGDSTADLGLDVHLE